LSNLFLKALHIREIRAILIASWTGFHCHLIVYLLTIHKFSKANRCFRLDDNIRWRKKSRTGDFPTTSPGLTP